MTGSWKSVLDIKSMGDKTVSVPEGSFVQENDTYYGNAEFYDYYSNYELKGDVYKRQVLQSGFIDTFRYFYPDQENIYSWWSYRFKAREKNAGWRIDYFIASPQLESRLEDGKIHTDILGSDHCPVELDLKI